MDDLSDAAIFRNQLPRFYELKGLLADPSHPDAYFQDFESSLREWGWLETFSAWENELQGLDPVSWERLKGKASSYLKSRHVGRGWRQLYDVLGEQGPITI